MRKCSVYYLLLWNEHYILGKHTLALGLNERQYIQNVGKKKSAYLHDETNTIYPSTIFT